MKLVLFQELLDLNQAFEEVLRGLKRMERIRTFQSDMVRRARADVETARVDANREFFDNFDAMVEDDALWAYKLQREYNRKNKDRDDVDFDIKDGGERRNKKGLSPGMTILPGRDMSDEDRYDEERAKKKRAARKKVGTTNRRKVSPAKGKRRAQAVGAPGPRREAKQ